MQMLCSINYALNGDKLALQDVTIHEAGQTSLKEQLERQRSDMAFAANDGLQPMHEHNAFTQEQQLLRQVKSIFVVTATLVSRAAIQGGLSPEDVFTLSDTYMQKCELPPRPGAHYQSAVSHGAGIHGAGGAAALWRQAHCT